MSGPNVTTWYGVLFGWMLGWLAGDYAVVVIVLAGVVAVLADKRLTSHQD